MKTRTLLLARFGTRVGTRNEGRAAQAVVWEELSALPEEAILTVDLSGVQVLSGSFADEALVVPVARLAAGELPGRYLVIESPSEDLVDDLAAKLSQRKLALLSLLGDGHSATLGHLPRYLAETLRWVIEHGEATSGDLAQALGVSPRAAATRIAQLGALRLVHIVPRPRSVGGVEHHARSLVSVDSGP